MLNQAHINPLKNGFSEKLGRMIWKELEKGQSLPCGALAYDWQLVSIPKII
jgi:hypothetical protein